MSISRVAMIVLIVLASLVVSIFLAAVRNFATIDVINALLGFIASIFVVVVALMEWLIARLEGAIGRLQSALSHKDDDFSLWDVVGPLIYFILLLVLMAGDAYFALETFPELFGGERPNINPAIFAPFSAVLWVSIALSLTAATMDLFGMTRLARPYGDAEGKVRRSLQIGSLIALGLLAIAGILFGLFRALLVQLTTVAIVDTAFAILLFVLIIVATLAAGFSIFYGPLAIILLIGGIFKLVATIVGYVVEIFVNALDKVAQLLVGIYDVLEHIGHVFWNWLSQVTDGTKWHVKPIPNHVPRPHLWDGVRVPRIGRIESTDDPME